MEVTRPMPVHTMLDPQVDAVRTMVDETAHSRMRLGFRIVGRVARIP